MKKLLLILSVILVASLIWLKIMADNRKEKDEASKQAAESYQNTLDSIKRNEEKIKNDLDFQNKLGAINTKINDTSK